MRTSETIVTHYCDLCLQRREESDLSPLFYRMKPVGDYGGYDHYRRIDICNLCFNLPVSQVFSVIENKWQ